MCFLSRIWLNPLRLSTQRFIENPQTVHAAVLVGIAAQPVIERTLWRLERSDRHRATLYVLSHSRPSWEHLVEQGGWPGSDEPQFQVRAYEPLLDQLVPGREFAFRLRANPVRSTKSPESPSLAQRERLATSDRPRGVRVAHRTAAHQLEWLLGRVEHWGFEVPTTEAGENDVLVVARDVNRFMKGSQHHVTLQTATYEGRLRVRDIARARLSLTAGVGPARAYGCGLITLSPLPMSDTGH